MHCALKASLIVGFAVGVAMLLALDYLPVWLRVAAVIVAALVATVGVMLEDADYEA